MKFYRAIGDKTDSVVAEALKKFTEFAADPAGKKSGISDVFTTVMRTAIIYDDDKSTNWHKMWKLLQVSLAFIMVVNSYRFIHKSLLIIE